MQQPLSQASPSREPGESCAQSKWLLKSAVGGLSSPVTVLEMNAFYNVIIIVLLLTFYCLLSPLYEAEPVIHISDLCGPQFFGHSLQLTL